MRKLPHLAAAAGLVCCLAASTAFADVASSQAGDSGAAPVETLDALQDLRAMITVTSPVSASSMLASATSSAGPINVPTTTLGGDYTMGVAGSGTVLVDKASGVGSLAIIAAANSVSAAPPPDTQGSITPHAVGSGIVVTPLDLLSVVALSGSASLPVANGTGQGNLAGDPPPVSTPVVPVPAAAFLLGSGLLGLIPLRRSSRLSPR